MTTESGSWRQKALAIACCLGWMWAGVALGGLVLHQWRPHYAGALTWAVGVALVLGVLELRVMAKLPDRLSRLLRLDAMSFPFFSVGVATAVILFAS